MNMLDKVHQVSHDVLAADIRENEDMLMQLNTVTVEPFSQAGTYAGYIGAMLSIILVLVFLGMCIKCKKRKETQNMVKMRTFKEISTDEKSEDEDNM